MVPAKVGSQQRLGPGNGLDGWVPAKAWSLQRLRHRQMPCLGEGSVEANAWSRRRLGPSKDFVLAKARFRQRLGHDKGLVQAKAGSRQSAVRPASSRAGAVLA